MGAQGFDEHEVNYLFGSEPAADFDMFPTVTGRQSAEFFQPVFTPRATAQEPRRADREGAVPGTPPLVAWGASEDTSARIAAALSPTLKGFERMRSSSKL